MANIHEYEAMTVKFLNKVTAKVSVKLVDADGENPADIYGHITGRYGIESEFVLFDVKQHDYIEVRPDNYIPLCRPEVHVPSVATNLQITAYLMDYDFITYDDEVANGHATFIVKGSGKSDSIPIRGKYGYVLVTVLWG